MRTNVYEDKQESFEKLLKLHTNVDRHLSQVMRLLSDHKYLSKDIIKVTTFRCKQIKI